MSLWKRSWKVNAVLFLFFMGEINPCMEKLYPLISFYDKLIDNHKKNTWKLARNFLSTWNYPGENCCIFTRPNSCLDRESFFFHLPSVVGVIAKSLQSSVCLFVLLHSLLIEPFNAGKEMHRLFLQIDLFSFLIKFACERLANASD